MKSMLHLGADVKKKSQKFIQESILVILSTSAGDAVKKSALQALSAAFTVQNVNLSNCAFNSPKERKGKP